MQVHQEGTAQEHRDHLSGMPAGRAGRTARPVRFLLFVQPVSRVHVLGEPEADAETLSGVRRTGGLRPGRGQPVHLVRPGMESRGRRTVRGRGQGPGTETAGTANGRQRERSRRSDPFEGQEERLTGMAAASSVAEEIAALRGTRAATFKDLLTHPSFSRLWRAMLVSSLGDWVGFVAVAALVARLGGSRLGALAVAGVMLARLLPSLLFGPFAGVFADRFDRRKLVISADVARGPLSASMPFLPGLGYIFLVSFFIESLSLVWTPAKDASIPNMVPRRQL